MTENWDVSAEGGIPGLGYMPERLPDELLFSWLSRSRVHHGSPDPVTFTRSLFGSKRISSPHDLPGSLKLLSSCLPTVGRLTPEALLWDMTLFPYYAAFADRSNRDAAMAALIEGEGKKGRALLGMNSRSDKLSAFRFCPECRDEDLATFGETFWRRSFQAEAALVCATHMRILRVSDCRPAGRHRFEAAVLSNCPDDAPPVAEVKGAAAIERLAGLTRAVQSLLSDPLEAMSSVERRRDYRRRYTEVGIACARGDKYSDALTKAMQDHWGGALEVLGSQARIDPKVPWPTRMATSNYGHSVIRHLLLRGLLDAARDGRYRRDRPFGNGPWGCENPLARHRGELTIAICELGRSYRGGGRVGIFECDCGYVYTRRLMPDGVVRRPVRQSWGPLLEPFLRGCLARGTGPKGAAAELECTAKTVGALAAHFGLDLGSPSGVYRNSWARTHLAGPRRRKSKPQPANLHRKGGARGRDWAAFDAELAPRLAIADAEIRLADPPVRVTLKELAARLGERPIAISSNLHRMPQVADVLQSSIETKILWDARRAPMVVKFLRENWDALPNGERLRLLASPGVRRARALDRASSDSW